MAPPAVMSFDATTATTWLLAFFSAASVSAIAASACQSGVHGSATILMSPRLDGIVERGHLSLANQLGVVVGLRAAEEDVVPFRRPIAQVLRLLLADRPVVVGQVQIDVGFQDQPVVADHGDGALLRGFDNLRRGFRAVRDHDQRLHAALEQRLGMLQLFRIVAFGGLDQDVGAQLLGAFQEQVAVALPAFLLRQRVHQEADFGSWLLLRQGSDDGRRRRGEPKACR